MGFSFVAAVASSEGPGSEVEGSTLAFFSTGAFFSAAGRFLVAGYTWMERKKNGEDTGKLGKEWGGALMEACRRYLGRNRPGRNGVCAFSQP